MTFYHYTTKTAHDEIQRSGKFVPSLFSIALDAKYGPGWYFTDLHPNLGNDSLYPLWGGPEPEKVQYYLEFDIDPTILQFCRANVYRLPHDRVNLADHIILSNNYTVPHGSTNKVVLAFKRFGDRILRFLGLN